MLVPEKMSLVPARGNVKRAVEIRDSFVDSSGKKSETLIFGNGDVVDLDDAERKVKELLVRHHARRAILENPWFVQ